MISLKTFMYICFTFIFSGSLDTLVFLVTLLELFLGKLERRDEYITNLNTMRL